MNCVAGGVAVGMYARTKVSLRIKVEGKTDRWRKT